MPRNLLMRLILAVLFCSLLAALSFADSDVAAAASDTTGANVSTAHKVIVYYLYFNPRCETCLNMEAYSREAVETGFGKELAQGSVEWHSYDTDQEEYKHYWDDFKLETKSLVLVDMRDGKPVRWKNCEKVWDLVGAKPDFLKHVQDEIRAYLTNE